MRVLHVIPCLDPTTGGPARSVPALCRALHQAKVDVTLYAMRRDGAGVTISPSDEAFSIRWFAPVSGSRQLPTLEFYKSIRKEVHRFDLIHLHSLWNPAVSVAALGSRQTETPYLLSPRGMLQNGALQRKRYLKKSYFWLWEYRTLYGARAVHFLSEAESRDSRKLLDGKVSSFVVPSGIDPELAQRITPGRFREAYPALENKRLLLFLGRLHWSKGLELQVRALDLVFKNNSNVIWVLVGPDEGEWDRLSRMIDDLHLRDHVLWTGPLPRQKCLEALADADVFLLTSRHEAHSMAMYEALAVGVPIVLTKNVQFNDAAASGAAKIVCWDGEEVAGATIEILRNQKLALEMRSAGRRFANERLAWPKIGAAMAERYEQILDGPLGG